MKWPFGGRAKPTRNLPIDPEHLPMPGWQFSGSEPQIAFWRDSVGDVVSLALLPKASALPPPSHTAALQTYCRRNAELQRAGLVELTCTEGANGASVTFVYKRLELPAFKFFGVILIPRSDVMWQWMVIAGERGTTGEREALVAAKMLEAGQLTVETYAGMWARDPYDDAYDGVDRSTLRYVSDAEEYDAEFPDHPLTKVRRELKRLVRVPLSNTAA
jgi:hypothetical protein